MTATRLSTRILGRTGLEVTTLGYGAMSLDSRFGRVIPQAQATDVLNAVLDAGITFIDTAPDYGPSEELIGGAIPHRRDEYVLATKCGCPVTPDAVARGGHVFTRENIVAAVEQSLKRMKTDHLDIVQFHGSPSADTLKESGAIETLQDLRRQGKIRFIGMSGTLPNLPGQIGMGVFDAFQIPYSALQREHESLISEAAGVGAGTVIRGGVARGAPSDDKHWDIRRLPEVAEDRPQRLWETAKLDDLLDGATRMEFMLRFTLSHPDLHTTIVGTANLEHLRQNLDAAAKGPLDASVYVEARRRLDAAAGQA